jgi:hypothetical protein
VPIRQENIAQCIKVLLIAANMEVAFLTFSHRWFSNASSESIMTPISFSKRVTKQFPGMKNLSYPERSKKLGLPTLAYRRIRGDLIEVYTIIKRCYDREDSSFLKLMNETGLRFSSRINSV